MRNGGQLRTENMTLVTLVTIAIAIFVVDATVYFDPNSGDYEPYNVESWRTETSFERRIVYDGDQVWRIQKENNTICNEAIDDLLKRYDEQGSLSIWTNHLLIVDIFVRNQMLDEVDLILFNTGIKYVVLIEDVQQAIREEHTPLTYEMQTELEGRKGHRMEWTTYHQLNDIYDFLDYLEDTYPDVCSCHTIGTSIEGRPIRVLRISNGKPNAPAIWIDGGIHAREWISPAAVTYMIDYLVERSETLKTDYYILPVVNPDGYEYTYHYDRLWRKNRRKGTRCAGVDLNRNFGYKWGGKGTSTNMCQEIYPGTKSFSEPETDAIRNFFENVKANFKAFVSFHSYGQYILYPWGYDKVLTPDYKELDLVGRQIAGQIKKEFGTEYTVGNSAITLYPAAGSSDDWAKAFLKIKYVYTIELRDSGEHGFMLPARYIIPTAEEALVAVKIITDTIEKSK